MKTTPVERIKELVKYLPKKDITYANKFIEKRDFESLRDLVESSIIIVEGSLKRANPKEEYLNIDLESLNSLASEVNEYCILLGIDDFSVDEDAFEENIEDIEYD